MASAIRSATTRCRFGLWFRFAVVALLAALGFFRVATQRCIGAFVIGLVKTFAIEDESDTTSDNAVNRSTTGRADRIGILGNFLNLFIGMRFIGFAFVHIRRHC